MSQFVPGQHVASPSPERFLAQHEERIRKIEVSAERKIYVGSVGIDGIDVLLAPDSPPFQNGWTQAMNELFGFVLRANQWVDVFGMPIGGPDNSVVTTLPAGYRPKEPAPFTSRGSFPGWVCTWRVEPTGEIIFETEGSLV